MTSRVSRVAILSIVSVVALGFFVARPVAQDGVQAPPARQILGAAFEAAKASDKNVFVHFSASWCGWCHKLEAFLKTPDGEALTKYAIDVQLVVQESGPKKILENPGGAEMMKAWGGTGGIPFFVFLDPTSKVLSDANNMPDKSNIGYPANPIEVKAFDDVVARGVPKMPADVRAKIMAYIAGHP